MRNVTLIPSMPFSFPQIIVFTFNKAISDNETMTSYLKIDGVADSTDYKAYIYLLTPEGKKLFYPDWSEEEKPIDGYYLGTNYYGRLPSTLKFSNFSDGTYILAGKIVDSLNHPISLSTDKVYHSKENSVKFYVNRGVFNEGQEVIVEHMLTGRGGKNGTLIISLEDPDGQLIYLPMLSEKPKVKEYNPVQSDYFITFNEFVNNWKEGTYILRSNLYNESGKLLDDDIVTFEVCRKISTLDGSYLRRIEDNDSSPFVFSRIRLIDFYTLKTQEFEFKGEHYGYSIATQAGRYYITGEAYSENGKAYYIPMVEVGIGCGENKTRNLELKYLEEFDLNLLPTTNETTTIGAPLDSGTGSDLCIQQYSLESFGYPPEPCPPVKIILYVDITKEALNKLQQEYPGDSPETLKRYFANQLRELLLKWTSGRVKIYTEVDRLDILRDIEESMIRNPSIKPDMSEFWKTLNPEYLVGLDIDYRVYPHDNKGRYVLRSELIDMDNNYIFVWGGEGISESVERALYNVINNPDPYRGYGDIASQIRRHEAEYPKPPRDPSVGVSSNKPSVTFEEGEDEAEITVRVLDCSGKPIAGTKIYFREITRRGYVEAEGHASWNQFLITQNFDPDDYVFSTTDSDGIAKAKYKLDSSKGTNAGSDIIEIMVEKRGQTLKSVKYVIRISGVKVEIKPEKETISPRQETDLMISLYKEELNGSREPLPGRTILIEKYGLLDGKIVVTGTADSYGNPVTDENGNAVIKYIAGKKEGIVKIPAVYQGSGYTNAPRDEAFIRVKKDEFVINIRWDEGYYTYTEWHSKRHCGEPLNEIWDASYSLNFEAKIIWDRKSEREVSTASVRYKEQGSGGWDGRLCWEEYYTCPGDPPDTVQCTNWCEDERGVHGQRGAYIYSYTRDSESFRRILKEGKSGDLFLKIDPIKIEMALKGQYTITSSGRGVIKKNGDVVDTYPLGKNEKYDYNGIHYSPAPPRFIDCLPGSHPKLPYYCYYFTPNNFPDDYIRLKKLGKNSYGAFHFVYPVKIDEEGYSMFFDAEWKAKVDGVKEMHVTVVKR